MKISTFSFFMAFIICIFGMHDAFAQRIYANAQQSGSDGLLCLNCQVTNQSNAVDGNLQSHSTIRVSVGLAAQTFQEAIFPATVPANTPVSLKIGSGDDLLSVQALGAVLIRPYNGATPAGPAVTASTLATALNNNNQTELTLTPALTYDRVRVTLDGGLVGVLNSMYLYDVYYKSPAAIACNTPVDELNGISSALLGLGLGIGGVQNPLQSFDGNVNTAATLNAGVGLLGSYAQQTIVYNTPSVVGDTIAVTLSTPQALVDAGVFSSITLRTFNGNTNNNDVQNLNSGLLTVRLLDLSGNRRRVRITYVPQATFDRFQLRLTGGIAAVLSSLDFHEAERIIPRPVITFNGGSSANAQVCSGTSATLAVAPIAGTTVNWYTAASGGSPVFTGNTFATPALTSTTTYYVSLMRTGCTDQSARVPVTVTVNPLPASPVITTTTVNICPGQTVAFTANTVAGVTINWYSAATGGTLLFSGNTYTTPELTQTTSYYAEAVNANNCASAARIQVTATVTPAPAAPALAFTTLNVNPGASPSISVTNPDPALTYNFYTVASGGTPVATGTSYSVPPVTTATTYYVEAVSAGNCPSATRTAVTINVNATPNITVTPPTAAVNPGQTATFTASSSTSGAIFKWYTTQSGGTPIFTGAAFTTPALSAGTTYYAEAVDPITNAASPRASATVTINGTPDIAVTPPTRAINAGQSTSFTASSTTPGATFNWYATPSAGTTIFTGATFTTPALSVNTTYYVESVDPATNARSARASAGVTINGTPNISVTPPAVSINSGQTTTFTASSTTPGAVFNWYTASSGGAPVFTGPSFTTPPITANTTFYAEATDPVTNAVSGRAPAQVSVNGRPDLTITPPSRNVNPGTNTTFTASSTTPGTVFYWYTEAFGGTPLFSGPTFTTPAINTNTTFYAEAVNPATNATSPRASAAVTVNGVPTIAVTPSSRTINAGQTTTFTASSNVPGAIFHWYTDSTGGSAIFTGATFTTPAITSNRIFYAEAVDPATNATSARASATVLINGAPDISVTPPSRSVNPGQTASFTASSTTPGTVFNWYDSPGSTVPVFTGAAFTSPPINGNTIFYVEAVNPATNATSSRIEVPIGVNGTPSLVVSPSTQNVNAGQNATFTATSTTPGVVISWYTDPTGGTPIFSGPTFTAPAATANVTYYAEAVDPATNATSVRVPGSIVVNGIPTIAVTPPTRNINPGQSTTFAASSNNTTAVFHWYDVPTGGTPVFSGPTFTTPALSTNTTYYAEAADPATGATSARATAAVTINGLPDLAITPAIRNINAGQSTTFTASSSSAGAIFHWYDTADGTSPIFTGAVFTTPLLNSNTIYYAEAVNPTTNAVSPRAMATVAINGTPQIAINPPSKAVDAGETATFTATSTTPGTVFNWYTDPTGGTPVFTGPVFTTPPLNTNTTYYAEAVNPATNATSDRVTAAIVINDVPDIAVVPPTQVVSSGATATFTATSSEPDVIVNWYDDPSDETPLFTGPIFTTPPINTNVTFYAEAVDPETGATSDRVPGSAVIAGGVPDITITPAIRNVNSRQTTTFTATSTTPGVVFRWFSTADGTTPVFTGPVFTTPAITSNVTFYAEAFNPGNNTVSARATASVTVNPAPDLSVVPPTLAVDAGRTAGFTATSTTPGATFNWYTTATGTTPLFTGPMFTTPPISGTTQFYVESVNPQTGATSLRTQVEVTLSSGTPLVFIPNAFSPNGDGRNDQLVPLGATLSNYDMRVYNQWGQLIFRSADYTKGWDGTWKGVDQPVGVYVYFLKGTSGDANKIDIKGTITLVR